MRQEPSNRLTSSGLRLVELLAPMSLATDIGMGHPMESGLASCAVAIQLGREMQLSEAELGRALYLSLLSHIGCTANSHKTAALVGDEIAMGAVAATLDFTKPSETFPVMLRQVNKNFPPLRRPAAIGRLMTARTQFMEGAVAVCEVARMLAGRLGFDQDFQGELVTLAERWDGRGFPGRCGGEDLSPPVRVVQVAEAAVAFCHRGGGPLAKEAIGGGAGTAFDPATAETFCLNAPALLAVLECESLWDEVVNSEPEPCPLVPEERIDDVLRAMGDFADLKSPYTVGHSSGVAELAARAGECASLSRPDVHSLRRAGWIHDVGRVGVSSMVWAKPRALTHGEWEKVRLHPYYTDRVLVRPARLGYLGGLASMHHERLDGSGYFRGVSGSEIPVTARILAAADVHHAMNEERPHREALTPKDAGAELQVEVRAGRLDGDAVDAVLEAAGHPGAGRKGRIAGLTTRELEVLRLVARGRTIKAIAGELFIAPKTADAHIQHIYTKIGVSSRAAATLFAMQHDLLGAPETGPER